MTKEELLQKGLSEDDADRIITALEESENPDNSLQLLEKALNEDSADTVEPLAKAKAKEKDDESDDESDDEDYNEKYMKKYMKRYMKENKKSCGKTAKEVGLYAEEMKKAIDEIDTNAEGAIVEMADLAPILKELPEVISNMAKAIQNLSDQNIAITDQNDKAYDILKKAGNLQVDTTKAINDFLTVPSGRKGKVSVHGENLSKGANLDSAFTKEATDGIYEILLKATKNNDRTAGQVISALESNGKDISKLTRPAKKFINDLMMKEAH